MTRASIVALTLAGGLLCGQEVLAQGDPYWNRVVAAAEDARAAQAPTFAHGFLWEQAVSQPVTLADGDVGTKVGSAAGGRLVAGVGLGVLGLEARVDVSGLKEEFAARSPGTIRTLEAFGVAHLVLLADPVRKLQVGPMVTGGVIRELRSQEGRAFEPGALAGAGLRVAQAGSELHLLAGWTSILPGHKRGVFAVAAAAHYRLGGQSYLVADVIVGPSWVLRSGIAVRAF